MRSIAFADRSTQAAARSRPGSRPWGMPATLKRRSPITTPGLRGSPKKFPHSELRSRRAPGIFCFCISTARRRRGRRTGFLLGRGLILRAVGAYGLPHCLRLTVGTEEANRLVAAALKDFVVSKAARVPDGLGTPLSEPLFQRLALIGMGLIGSSLAHVCRRKGLAREIAAADTSAAVRETVKELALADRGL